MPPGRGSGRYMAGRAEGSYTGGRCGKRSTGHGDTGYGVLTSSKGTFCGGGAGRAIVKACSSGRGSGGGSAYRRGGRSCRSGRAVSGGGRANSYGGSSGGSGGGRIYGNAGWPRARSASKEGRFLSREGVASIRGRLMA